MIVLDTINKKLELVLGAAHTTNALDVSVFYYDVPRASIQEFSEFVGASSHTQSNGTTTVTILAAPVNGVVRNVKHVAIPNKDTIAQTVTVKLDLSGTEYSLVTVTLEPASTLVYDQHNGWQIVPEPCCEGDGDGGGGTGNVISVRCGPNGSVKYAVGVEDPVSNPSEGVYLATITTPAIIVSGEPQITAVATAHGIGDNDDDVLAFKEFDDYDYVLTGDHSGEDWYYSPATNNIYVLCLADSNIWVHDLDNFTTAATTIAATDTIRTEEQSGVMSTDGERLYLSGDTGGGGFPIRVLVTATGTVTTLGSDIDAICVAADDNGNLYTYESSNIKKYTPNIGGGSLGSVVATWGVTVQRRMTFDHDGNLWGHDSTAIYCIETGTSGTFSVHSFPIPPIGLGTTAIIMADFVNRCLYLPLEDVDGIGYLYKYSGWLAGLDDSGVWEKLFTLPGIQGVYSGGWYDPASGVYFGKDSSTTQTAQRILPNSQTSIDTVSIDDTTGPDNPQIDYNLDNARHSFYKDNYGYVIGAKGADIYLIRISYNGPEIEGAGGGGFISAVIFCMTRVVDDETIRIETFESLSPIIRRNASFSMHATVEEA